MPCSKLIPDTCLQPVGISGMDPRSGELLALQTMFRPSKAGSVCELALVR